MPYRFFMKNIELIFNSFITPSPCFYCALTESYLFECSATTMLECNHSAADVDILENSCIFANQNV